MITNIAVLLTVYNRIDKTKKCLECLDHSIAQLHSDDTIFDIYLTDDGSDDGTSEYLSTFCPAVNIVRGNGDLYWSRGMVLAWKNAISKKKYAAFLWLNNDSFLYPKALSVMLQAFRKTSGRAIITGAFCSSVSGIVTYGGKIKENIVAPNGKLQNITQLNGNFVLISEYVFSQLGMIDAMFHHALGDYDYGYRALKKRIPLLLTSEYVGECERNNPTPLYCQSKKTLLQRFQYLYSPLGPSPITMFRFNMRHFNFFIAIKNYIGTNIMCLFPYLFRLRYLR